LARFAVARMRKHDSDEQVELIGLRVLDGQTGSVGPQTGHGGRPPNGLPRGLRELAPGGFRDLHPALDRIDPAGAAVNTGIPTSGDKRRGARRPTVRAPAPGTD